MLEQGGSELQKLIQMVGDYAHRDGEQQPLVVMHCDIAKAHHFLERLGQRSIDTPGLRQQIKHIASALGDAQLVTANEMVARASSAASQAR